mmetsp:Transcript_9205/g.9165  ORF Transcript_9205/g.9165 Transcript_9205/m.9165 type:complete len:164 (-) Transcript_9205:218-709(-)
MASSGSSSPHSRHDSHSPSPHSPRRSRSPPRRVSLLVRNLVIFTQDPHTRSEDIRNHFSKYGEVRDVYIPRDYYTQRPRGFCFVEFNKYDDAKAALEKTDGTELQGSTVKIVFAREGRKGPDEMRRRDRWRRRRSSSPRYRRRSRSRTPPRHTRRDRSESSSR